ncbi:MAG: ion transporter, partial [Aminobacteriaceae bacterium]
MGTSYTEKNFAGRLELFFKNSVVEAVLLFLISASVVAAIASLLFHNDALEHLNLFFSVVFSIELTARYFTYDGKKKEYFRDWWMDWVAT